jgi:hypothetical protein
MITSHLIGVAGKLFASLVAVLALGQLARWMALGGDVRIRDADHARMIARDSLFGFAATDVALDLGGYSALVKDAQGRHALINTKGAHFVARLVKPPIEGRLDRALLTLDLGEPDFDPVTLNLGEKAQYWASGLRHIPSELAHSG